jgi:hypothetical protein
MFTYLTCFVCIHAQASFILKLNVILDRYFTQIGWQNGGSSAPLDCLLWGEKRSIYLTSVPGY